VGLPSTSSEKIGRSSLKSLNVSRVDDRLTFSLAVKLANNLSAPFDGK
jgi:hypothetical protein